MTRLEHATVSDAMHRGIHYCEPGASLSEVARTMATYRVHCVVVLGVVHEAPMESLAWGIISDVDLVRAAVPNGEGQAARSLTRQPVITVEPTTPLREAGELMLAHGATHLVVVQAGTRRPLGILSTLDIARVIGCDEA